jgi:hypothetical protein
MNRLLRTIVGCAVAPLCLGACAKQGDDPYAFVTAPPDASVPSSNDASLGGGDGPLAMLPPVVDFDVAPIVINISDSASTVGSSDGAPPNSLTFVPPSATITIDGTGPKTQSFILQADFGSGPTNVTAEAVEFDRPDLAAATDQEPVIVTAPAVASPTPYGGTGLIHAVYHGVEATAAVTVQVHLTTYAQGLSASSPGVAALGGANLGADPATGISPILYPYNGTVWPLGLTSPLVMWNGPSASDVYRLTYAEKNYIVDDYTTLAQLPAQARLDQTTWDRLTNSNDSLHGNQDPITFTLSRWDSASQTAYTSATSTWSVAPESLQGAIYYWSASQNAMGTRLGHISRFQPGTGAAPQVLNNGTCMGCHAVNAQGTMLVADIDDQANGTVYPSVAPYDNWSKTRAWSSFDITQASSPVIYKSNEFGADVALTPDAKYLVFGGNAAAPGSKYISLGDPKTGIVVATSGLDSITLDTGEGNLMMPAFSPDGKMLALVESNCAGCITPRDNVLPSSPESIVYLNFDESVPSFDPTLHKVVDGSSATFTTTGGALGYPSFTPDSKAVAFHSGMASTGCNSSGCDDGALDDGNLFITNLAAGSTPVRLGRASDPPAAADLNASVEPTFNPVVRGGYSWAVFTSMRTWGNQPWPAELATLSNCATGTCNGKRRLWVAPVDTTISTADPSHPAIYLEGQEDTPNMRAFWTLAGCIPTAAMAAAADAGVNYQPVGTACTNGFECCSGFCQNSMCVEPSQSACVGLGGACKQTGDCCNSPIVQCLEQVCAIPMTR